MDIFSHKISLLYFYTYEYHITWDIRPSFFVIFSWYGSLLISCLKIKRGINTIIGLNKTLLFCTYIFEKYCNAVQQTVWFEDLINYLNLWLFFHVVIKFLEKFKAKEHISVALKLWLMVYLLVMSDWYPHKCDFIYHLMLLYILCYQL